MTAMGNYEKFTSGVISYAKSLVENDRVTIKHKLVQSLKISSSVIDIKSSLKNDEDKLDLTFTYRRFDGNCGMGSIGNIIIKGKHPKIYEFLYHIITLLHKTQGRTVIQCIHKYEESNISQDRTLSFLEKYLDGYGDFKVDNTIYSLWESHITW